MKLGIQELQSQKNRDGKAKSATLFDHPLQIYYWMSTAGTTILIGLCNSTTRIRSRESLKANNSRQLFHIEKINCNKQLSTSLHVMTY